MIRVAIVVLLALFVAGAVFLATWDIPPPTRQIEKVLPNERFPR